MNSHGDIVNLLEKFDRLPTVDEVRYRGLEPIPDDQLAMIMAMPRKDRRKWFVQQRRLQRKAKP